MEKENQKELLFNNLVIKAKKAADAAAKLSDANAADEICRCVALLKELKSFPVSKEVMASTRADTELRLLKLHNKDRIRLMAKWLFETWRPLIKDRISDHFGITSSTKSTKHESFRHKRRIETDGAFPAKKPKIGCPRILEEKEEQAFSCFKKPAREPKGSKKEEQRDDVSIKCSDATRNKIRENLVKALSKVTEEAANGNDEEIKERVKACDPVGVAVSVESFMFKKMGPYSGANKLKYISIMFNIKDARNPDFRRKVLLREIKPERLATINTEEMASDERQSEINQMKERAMANISKPISCRGTSEAIR